MSQPPDAGPPPEPTQPLPPPPVAYDPFVPPSAGPTQPAPPPAFGQPAFGQPPGFPAHPAYPGYGYPAEPERSSGTDGFAIASLVLGILSVIPLGIIFGFVALRRIVHNDKRGRGLAIAGILISFGWVLVIFAGIALTSLGQVSPGDNGTITTAGRVAAADLHVGDCIQLPTGSTTSIETFDAVPCSAPHDAEAYAGGTLALTGDWPGEDSVQKATDTQCSDAFEPFIGVGIDDSVLDVSYFYPEQDAWDNGDRGYVCVVGSSVTKTTGTLKGAAR